MKKTLKGFTLVECLIALLILGIASLTMAQIYASVSLINRENNLYNKSLAYQVKYAEQAVARRADNTTNDVYDLSYSAANTNTDGKVPVDADGNFTPEDTPTNRGVQNTMSTPYLKVTSADGTLTYSYAVDLQILKSRKSDTDVAEDLNGDGNNENTYLNYKYFLPHNR